MKYNQVLEFEEKRMLLATVEIVNNLQEDKYTKNGRPPVPLDDVIKSLIIMTHHGLSYRRCYSSLSAAREIGILNKIPKKTTICRYMNYEITTNILSQLIQKSAMRFIDSSSTLILDSTWYGTKMYVGGYCNKPTSKRNPNTPPLAKCMKLHLGVLKESRIIAYATTSLGTVHDNNFFKEIVSKVMNNGFNIKKLLADSGYLSKDNYKFAEELGIGGIFIDFKSNITGKRSGSKSFKEAFSLYQNNHEKWVESYGARAIIESVNSVLKRKYTNWLRTRKPIARTNELLLKVLCYNLTLIGRKEVNYYGD